MGDTCEDLQEEDVWGVSREKERSPKMRRSKEPALASPAAKKLPTASARSDVVRDDRDFGFSGGGRRRTGAMCFQQSTSPVNIPDWSKIYGSKNSSSEGRRQACRSSAAACNDDVGGTSDALDYDEEEEEGEGMLPPHEWIARKLARSQISSFSVCEGAGRTLKGRDLSRTRNAVLSRTGFLE